MSLIGLGDLSPCCKSICQAAAASLSDIVTVLGKLNRVTYFQTRTAFTLNFSVVARSERKNLKLRRLSRELRLPTGPDGSLFYLRIVVNRKQMWTHGKVPINRG